VELHRVDFRYRFHKLHFGEPSNFHVWPVPPGLRISTMARFCRISTHHLGMLFRSHVR
jgi:hypothetical protein